ncbi:MAG: sulfite exporter TauE/SafE family protein [Saprospiraceae bacterium]|nr:sulfite exporter TauE/SafE family protein [Saprospiraceae bacterium]
MDWITLMIALFGGLVAGGINTLAGNGSAITLLILTELLGLSPNMANGSNRLGVFAGSASATLLFARSGKLNFKRSQNILWPTLVGSVVGFWAATQVSNEQFYWIFKIMLVVMLVVILVNPRRWLITTQKDFKLSPWIVWPLFLAIGFYGGFIQMGMGIFFLAGMVLAARYSIIDANGVKVWLVAFYTLFGIAIFHWQGLIDWKAGGLLAIGQAVGGFLAARFATKHPKANLWAYRLLVLIIVLAILRLFGLFSWLTAG